MTSKEFKQARVELGLSVSQLAYILNTNKRTVLKWESDTDERIPNPIAVRVLGWLQDGFRPSQYPSDV